MGQGRGVVGLGKGDGSGVWGKGKGSRGWGKGEGLPGRRLLQGCLWLNQERADKVFADSQQEGKKERAAPLALVKKKMVRR